MQFVSDIDTSNGHFDRNLVRREEESSFVPLITTRNYYRNESADFVNHVNRRSSRRKNISIEKSERNEWIDLVGMLISRIETSLSHSFNVNSDIHDVVHTSTVRGTVLLLRPTSYMTHIRCVSC